MSRLGEARVLLVDDEEVMQDVLAKLFGGEGFLATIAATGEEALARLNEQEFDLVLLDLMLPGVSGMEVLDQIRAKDPDLPVVMVTAYATVENAIEAMKRGAFDYVVKPFRNDELALLAGRAIGARRLQLENRSLRRELGRKYSFANILGASEKMQRVFDVLAQAAPSRSTILIQGESGTGKELVARAIHQASPRKGGAFVTVASATVPPELQESALFGHVKGAFPNASASRRGLFEMADGGSLFLDEVASLHADVQAKLLRVIQEREVQRLGSEETIPIDVRIIAATHADLRQEVEAKRFRADLFYRLNVISVRLPPLRERAGDVRLLANHFLRFYAEENQKKVRSISAAAVELLESHSWPGNVRELSNVVQKAVVLCRGEEIDVDLLADDLRDARAPARNGLGAGGRYKDLVEEFEKDVILDAMRRSEGVQKRAAEILGLKPTTLNEKLKRLRIRYKA